MANKVTQYSDGVRTFYTIEGAEAYVAAEIERIQRDYPAGGYSTQLGTIEQDANGHTTARVRRFNSCD